MTKYATLKYSKKQCKLFSLVSNRIIFSGSKKECKQFKKAILKRRVEV